MASFKVRRSAIFNSDVTIAGTTTLNGALTQTGAVSTGKLTTGSLTVSSGSTTISSSGMKVGAAGTKFTRLNFGTLTVTSPSFGAITTGSSQEVDHTPFPGVEAGDKVFVQAGSLGLNLAIVGASATAASTITVMYSTTACIVVAENALVSLNYLAISS